MKRFVALFLLLAVGWAAFIPLSSADTPLASSIPNVPPVRYRPLLDVSSPIINAINVTRSLGLTGKGVKVAVIDTGIDQSNPFFEKLVSEGRLQNFTCPGAAGPLYDHGSHVSGILAGNYSNYVGIAPGVTLLMYDCDYYGGFYDGDLSWAIDDAISRGAKIISMSLGGLPYYADGFSDPFDNFVNNRAYYNDVLFVVAAGNSGDEPIHKFVNITPGSYENFSITRFDNLSSVIVRIYVYNQSSMLGFDYNSVESYIEKPKNPLVVGSKGVVENYYAQFLGLPFVGSLVNLIVNNTSPYTIEAHVLTDYGSIVGGDGGFTVMSPSTAYFSMSVGSYVSKPGVGSPPKGSLSAFSSRGPPEHLRKKFYGALSKPNVIAPGEWITSASSPAVTATYSGTSMAAPHVAGMAALLLEAAPGLSFQDLFLSILFGNQTDLGLPNKDTGWGLVDVNQSYYVLPYVPSFLSKVKTNNSVILSVSNEGKIDARLQYFSNSSETPFSISETNFFVEGTHNITITPLRLSSNSWVNVSFLVINGRSPFFNASIFFEIPQNISANINCSKSCEYISTQDTINVSFTLEKKGNVTLIASNGTNLLSQNYNDSGYFNFTPFRGHNFVNASLDGANISLFEFTSKFVNFTLHNTTQFTNTTRPTINLSYSGDSDNVTFSIGGCASTLPLNDSGIVELPCDLNLTEGWNNLTMTATSPYYRGSTSAVISTYYDTIPPAYSCTVENGTFIGSFNITPSMKPDDWFYAREGIFTNGSSSINCSLLEAVVESVFWNGTRFENFTNSFTVNETELTFYLKDRSGNAVSVNVSTMPTASPQFSIPSLIYGFDQKIFLEEIKHIAVFKSPVVSAELFVKSPNVTISFTDLFGNQTNFTGTLNLTSINTTLESEWVGVASTIGNVSEVGINDTQTTVAFGTAVQDMNVDVVGNYGSAWINVTVPEGFTPTNASKQGTQLVFVVNGRNVIFRLPVGDPPISVESKDLTPPPLPSLTASSTTNSLTIYWKDPQDPTWNKTIVKLYAKETREIDSPAASTSFSNLPSSTGFTVGVSFVDDAGNQGNETNISVSTKTPAISSTSSSSSGGGSSSPGIISSPPPKPHDTTIIGNDSAVMITHEIKRMELWGFSVSLGKKGQLNISKINLTVVGYDIDGAFQIHLFNASLAAEGLYVFKDPRAIPVDKITEDGTYFIGRRNLPPIRYKPLEAKKKTNTTNTTPMNSPKESVKLEVNFFSFFAGILNAIFNIFHRFF